MEIIESIISWLFLETIYGIGVIAGVVYLLFSGIKKVLPKSPNPAALAALAFFVALFTVPSIPRYQFESESLSQLEGKNWIRVINMTKWGSVTEPLTWFSAPIGSIFMVMPNSPIEGGYREVLLRYDEEPEISMSNPDCKDKSISYAKPDSEGVFRYTSASAQPMNEQEISIYCDYDWSKEIEALRTAMLDQMKSQ